MAYSSPVSQEENRTPRRGVPWGWIVAALIVVTIVLSFFIRGTEGSIQYYMTVSEYLTRQPKYQDKKIKLAGHVKAGTLKKDGSHYQFAVEDLGKEIQVSYDGVVPDTFKEGVEVVVTGRGRLDQNFVATDLMAKCASKYQEGGLPPIERMRGKSVY